MWRRENDRYWEMKTERDSCPFRMLEHVWGSLIFMNMCWSPWSYQSSIFKQPPLSHTIYLGFVFDVWLECVIFFFSVVQFISIKLLTALKNWDSKSNFNPVFLSWKHEVSSWISWSSGFAQTCGVHSAWMQMLVKQKKPNTKKFMSNFLYLFFLFNQQSQTFATYCTYRKNTVVYTLYIMEIYRRG